MELDMSFQLYQASSALLLGLSIGLFYDFLKAIRRRAGGAKLTFFTDILFWLSVATALFVQTMTVGRGELRIFMQVANAGGALLYFLVLSPAVLLVWGGFLDELLKILRIIGAPARAIWAEVKKVLKILKKDFQKMEKQCTIKRRRLRSEEKSALQDEAGGELLERQRGKYFYQTGGAGADRIRLHQLAGSAQPDRKRARPERKSRRNRGRSH